MSNEHLVVMGVAGCGKSTVAEELRNRLGWEFAEGDDFHPEANIAKMSSGTPLTDEDRWPWLDLIAEWTAEQDAAGRSTIVTCSALRRVYRDRLRNAPGRTLFVHLVGSPELLEHRLSSRSGHFMPPTLLPSQLATLEPLESDEEGVALDIARPVSDLAQSAIDQLHLATTRHELLGEELLRYERERGSIDPVAIDAAEAEMYGEVHKGSGGVATV